MILMRILPDVLKELSKHVPTVLFQTVEWNELIHELPKISRRIIQKEGFNELFEARKIFLTPLNIQLTNSAVNQSHLAEQKWAAEKLLTLYFTQLFSSQGLFLDLRLEHFENQKPNLIWHPSHLWTKFNEDFRLGLLDVYEGFYLGNDDLYYLGLGKIGLLKPNFTESENQKLGEIFKEQFGKALDEEMSFDLDHFKSSIIKLSHFMLEKKVHISKDFLYLGIYLVTLYSSLEKIKVKLPVKKIFLEAREYLKSKELS